MAVALGSSLGDRRAHLDFAIARLSGVIQHLARSRYHETEPVDVPVPSGRFLNAAAIGETTLQPRELLDALFAIERDAGRARPFANAPRTLDLDLILDGDRVIDEPGLTVPHPRFRQRRFVLEPLAEIGGALVDPVTGRTMAELLRDVR